MSTIFQKQIKDIFLESKTLVNILFTFGARILKALTVFVLMILIARRFGPEGKGIITMALFLPDFLYFMLHLGLGNASIFFISNQGDDEKAIYNNSVWQGLGLSLISILLVLGLKALNPNVLGIGFPNAFLYLALAIVPFSFLETFFENIFAGRQEFKIFNKIIIVDRFLMIFVMLMAFMNFKIKLIFVLILFLVNLILQVLVYFLILVRKFG
jgi:O-antigen/teichoic acid export membrane protein